MTKQPKLSDDESVSEYSLAEKLKSIYRAHDHMPKLIEDDGIQQQSLEEYYIKLQVILNREFAASHQEAMQDMIAGDKEFIEINDIFAKLPNQKEESEKEINKILLLGTAGIGKSTLMHYLSYLWSKDTDKSLWADKFDYVFRVRLKVLLDSDWSECYEPKQIQKNRLECFLHRCLEIEDRKQVKNLKLTVDEIIDIQDKGKVLLLLDGYDEIQHIADKGRNKEIFEDIFDYRHVIMTSRPNALKDFDIHKFDRQIENIGFDNEGILQYVTRNFAYKTELAKELTNFLSLNGEVNDICRTPINTTLLCIIWHDHTIREQLIQESTNLNISKLYEEIIVYLGKRYISKFKGTDTENITNKQIFNNQELKFLQKIAYQALKETGKLITSTIVQSNINNLDIVEISKYGLTRPEGSRTKVIDNNHQFIHLTFQEYLTAYYLQEELLNSEPPTKLGMAQFIANHRNEPKYLMTLKFLSGMVSRSDNEELVRNFWEIVSCNVDGVLELGLESKVTLLMHLLSQAVHKGTMDSRIPNLDKIVELIDDTVLLDITRWEIQIVRSGYLSDKIEEKVKNILENYKNSGGSRDFITALEVVTNLIHKSKNHDKGSLCHRFVETIKSQELSWQIKKITFTKLHQIIDDILSEKVLIDVLDVCRNNFEDKDVQSIIKAILLKIVKINSSLDMQVIDILNALLKCNDSSVQRSVVCISKEVVKANPKLIKDSIKLLKDLLKDCPQGLKELVTCVLKEVLTAYFRIDILEPFTKDDNWSLRKLVVDVLRDTVKDANCTKLSIELLTPLISDDDLGLKLSARDAILRAVKVDFSYAMHFMKTLKNLLKGDNPDFKTSYFKVLATDFLQDLLKQKSDIAEHSIEILKILLEDSNVRVQTSALNALQEIVKADSNLAKEGIKMLTPLFEKNNYASVKISAANALQEIVKADSNLAKEGIKLLTPLFKKNNDYEVKVSAAEALQEIVKADSNLAKEGIKMLTPLFEKNNYASVKISAANALEEIVKADSNLAQEVMKLLKPLFEKNNDYGIIISAAEALQEIVKADATLAKEGMELLKPLFEKNNDYRIIISAAKALQEIVKADSNLAKEGIKLLTPLFEKNNDYEIRVSAAKALQKIVKADSNLAKEGIKLLTPLFEKNNYASVKISAANALQEIVKADSNLAKEGIKLLTPLFENNDRDVKISAANALREIAKADSNLTQEVTNLLNPLFEKDNYDEVKSNKNCSTTNNPPDTVNSATKTDTMVDDSAPSIAEILKSHLRDIKHVNVQNIPTNEESQLDFIKSLLMNKHSDIKTAAVAVLDKIVRLKPESIKIDMIESLYPVIKYDGAESTLINIVTEVAQHDTENVVKILKPLFTNEMGYNAQISGVTAIIEAVKVDQNYADQAIKLLELIKTDDRYIKNSVLVALKEFLPMKSTLIEQGFKLIKHLLKDADSDFEKSAMETFKDLVIDIIDLDTFAGLMQDDLATFRNIVKQVIFNKLDIFQNVSYIDNITAILKIIDVTDDVDEELDKKLNIAAKKALYDLPDKLYHSSLEMINKNFEEINQTKESGLYLKKLCHMVFSDSKMDKIKKELIVKCIKIGISIIATNTGKVMFEGQTYRLDLENDEATAKNFEDIIDVAFEQTSNNDTHSILENTGSLLPVAASDILDVSSLISKNHTLKKSSLVITLLSSTSDSEEFIFYETRNAFGYVEIYVNDPNSVPIKFHPNQQQKKIAEVFKVLAFWPYDATTTVLERDEIPPSGDINIKKLMSKHNSKNFIVDKHHLLIGNSSTFEHQIMDNMNTRISHAEKNISELRKSLQTELHQLKDSIKKNLNQEQEKVQKIEENLNSILKKSESLNNDALISCIRDIDKIRKELETINPDNINNLEQKLELLARKMDEIDQEGQAQDLWYVKDIRYDNKLLNHPELIQLSLKYFGISQVIDMSDLLSDELIEESILYNQGDLLLAGFISVDA